MDRNEISIKSNKNNKRMKQNSEETIEIIKKENSFVTIHTKNMWRCNEYNIWGIEFARSIRPTKIY